MPRSRGVARRERHVLAREQQRATGRRCARCAAAHATRRLDRVARPPHVELRDQPQARRVLDRLVRRAVLAEADRVVREHEDVAQLHQRRHAQRVARVVGEREERAVVGEEAAVQREAVADRGHRELAHAEVDVVAGRVAARRPSLPDQLVNTEPVRSAEPPIISGRCFAYASIACCDALRVATVSPFASCAATNASTIDAKSAGKPARDAPLELRAKLRMRGPVGGEARFASRPRAPRRFRARPTRRRFACGISNAACVQPSASRVAATSFSPSAAPCTSAVPALVARPCR